MNGKEILSSKELLEKLLFTETDLTKKIVIETNKEGMETFDKMFQEKVENFYARLWEDVIWKYTKIS